MVGSRRFNNSLHGYHAVVMRANSCFSRRSSAGGAGRMLLYRRYLREETKSVCRCWIAVRSVGTRASPGPQEMLLVGQGGGKNADVDADAWRGRRLPVGRWGLLENALRLPVGVGNALGIEVRW